jgi:serine/threonine protein kinase, bacterial
VISDTSDTVVATVSVGRWPFGVAYDPARGDVFVTNFGDGTVSVISDSTRKVVTTMSVGSGPWDVTHDPSAGELFATDYHDDIVSVIADAYPYPLVARVSGGTGPVAVTFDASRGKLFVADGGGDTISVIEPGAAPAAASASQPSRGQLVAGINYDALILIVVVVLTGLAIGTGAWRRARRASS